MKRLLLLASAALVLTGIVIAGAYGWLERQWEQPMTLPPEGVVVEVSAGESLGRVLRRAEAAGWLSHARWVGLVAAQRGLDAGIHVGEYRLDAGLTAAGLVAQLGAGDTIEYQVTLPEGIRLSQALGILCGTEHLRCTLSGPEDPALLALLPQDANPEGWFLPETYRFTRGDTDLDVLDRAHTLMQQTLASLWQRRAPDLPIESPYEALILASIIERETGVAAERGRIAGVFIRRLQKGMRLQTDPTVIYGLGDAYAGNLTRAHLRDDENPYNTYRIDGLPPTPIALPGSAALAAAVSPESGEDLYFVARGDGSHEFAATLEAHQDNVRRFQLQRRSDYRSSPP